MKKSLALLISLIIVTSVFSSCVTDVTDNISDILVSSVSESAESMPYPEQSADSGGEDVVEPEPEIDYFTKNFHSVLPNESNVPSYMSETETKHLYDSQIYLPESEGYGIISSGENLVLSYWQNDMPLCSVFSLETGEEITTITTPISYMSGSLDDGGFWMFDNDNYSLALYDNNGKEINNKVSITFDFISYPNSVYVTKNANYLLISYDNVTLEIYDLNTGEVSIPEMKPNLCIYDISETEEDYILEDNNSTVYKLNKETQEITSFQNSEYIYGAYEGLYQNAINDDLLLSSVYCPEKVYMSLAPYEIVTDINCGIVATCVTDEENYVCFYDLRNKKLISKLDFEIGYYGIYSEILPNGTAFIMLNGTDESHIYFYDLVSASAEATEDITDIFVCTEAEILQLIEETAEEIYKNLGVELIYGSQGNDYIIYDYVGVAELNAFKIYKAVNTVYKMLKKYPEGMLRESYECGYNGLKIYLCGNIHGVDSGSLSSAAGFVSESNGYIILALNVNDNLEYNIPHELSHVFDRRINSITSTDWMSVWENATPFVDAYHYSYENYLDYNDYIYEYEDMDDVWFVDNYSRTFPTEDRACIMERLFASDSNNELDFAFDCPNLLYKAKLYSYILRQCFPSCDTDEIHIWERGLGVIDSSVLSE